MDKKNLVIVESPAKAKTISRILDGQYVVKATMGHVRDLPAKKLGVDVENDFAPHYQILPGKQKIIKEIKAAAKTAGTIYLATDPDREGEAISWHLIEAAGLKRLKFRRVTFHEITKPAITKALRHPGEIDLRLVNAQQARRIIDRLVGYKISPILWRKVRRGLSAGRVQSAALRMIVEREREIEEFTPQEYWSIEAELRKRRGTLSFKAKLINCELPSEAEADKVCQELEKANFKVARVEQKITPRQPVPPFITSTLQQEAWRKLRFSASHTMSIAQQLYEGLPLGGEEAVGLITYMRTDSTRVSSQALKETRTYISEKYGQEFVSPSPRIFAKKVKGAQEAHEAIRPTSIRREPERLKTFLSADQLKLYELIWKRMMASQMAAASLNITTVEVEARPQAPEKAYLFQTKAAKVSFPGFLVLYQEGKDEEEGEEESLPLPELREGEPLLLLSLFPEQHFTKPPPRYTEATLVKALEQNGIGRPSTYAPIISTLQQRGYVKKERGHFEPQEIGSLVTDLLKEHFPKVVDLGFTAQMEKHLDEIAWGEREWIPTLRDFYQPFSKTVARAASTMQKVKLPDKPTDEICEKCGRPMVIRQGRYGNFLACSGYPECKNTRPLPIEARCPRCGARLVERRSKKGRTFYGCSNYPKCDFSLRSKPLPQVCPQCQGLLIQLSGKTAKCINCGHKVKLEALEANLASP